MKINICSSNSFLSYKLVMFLIYIYILITHSFDLHCLLHYKCFQMVDLCRSFMLEAKWFYTGYKPSFQEYIENAWISIAAPVVLVHAYFLVTNPITTEALECLEGYPDIIRWSSLIVRLTDDLGTSKVRMLQIASSACIQYMITPKYTHLMPGLIPGLFGNKL